MLKPIAQELSEAIARSIGYDVVITDLAGLTIGCSDPTRGHGSLNEACAIVARTGEPRWESEEEAQRLKGTKAGATYPIMDIDNHVVGTIAITGDPDKVRPFALLVKNQAELYLRERLIARELQERERNLQALVADIALFREGVNDPHLIETRASLMGYDKNMAYVVLVIDTANSESGTGYSDRERFLADIRRTFSTPGDVSGPIGPHRYVVFRAVPRHDGYQRSNFFDGLKAQCNSLLDAIVQRGHKGTIGTGGIAEGIAGLSESYRAALVALQVGGRLFKKEPVHCIINYRIEELMLGSETGLQDAMVERELAPLFARTDGDELQDTIVAWCESGFSVVRAAELLHVHRTTVDYRLEKLEHILAVKPRDFREMSRLYWAVVLWRNGRGSSGPKRRRSRRS